MLALPRESAVRLQKITTCYAIKLKDREKLGPEFRELLDVVVQFRKLCKGISPTGMELAEILGWPVRTIYRRLVKLEIHGYLYRRERKARWIVPLDKEGMAY